VRARVSLGFRVRARARARARARERVRGHRREQLPLGTLEPARVVQIKGGEEPVGVRLGGWREHLRHVLRHLAVELQAHAVQLHAVDRAVLVSARLRARVGVEREGVGAGRVRVWVRVG